MTFVMMIFEVCELRVLARMKAGEFWVCDKNQDTPPLSSHPAGQRINSHLNSHKSISPIIHAQRWTVSDNGIARSSHSPSPIHPAKILILLLLLPNVQYATYTDSYNATSTPFDHSFSPSFSLSSPSSWQYPYSFLR